MSTISRTAFASFLLLTSLLLTSTLTFATDFTVNVGGAANVFTPKNQPIKVGDSVTFVNVGGFHNVVANDGSFSSGDATSDPFTLKHVFSTAGTFKYYCEIHGSASGAGMAGTVTVSEATTTSPPAAPISPAISGSWYDSAQNGHGFSLQVAPGNLFIAYWFVYTPDGTQQAWVTGSGAYDPTSNSVTIEGAQRNGAKFPPNFVETDLSTTDWGTLTFTFTDCNTGTVAWNSKLASYGSGTLPISKIIGVSGLTCPN